MGPEKESPALAARGNPETDLAGASICPDNRTALHQIQVARLTRRCAVTAAMAAIMAPFVFGEGTRS